MELDSEPEAPSWTRILISDESRPADRVPVDCDTVTPAAARSELLRPCRPKGYILVKNHFFKWRLNRQNS